MKGKKHNAEQIINKPREADAMLAAAPIVDSLQSRRRRGAKGVANQSFKV